MNIYEKTFEWVQFPEGRARFDGGIRGGDERRHETYALELEGKTQFGEIDSAFVANGNDYNVEVISFGYGMIENVGNPHQNARGTYTEAQLKIVRSLVAQLIRNSLQFEERPSILRETSKSHFLGKILFREGWAYARPETLLKCGIETQEKRHEQL